MDPRIEIHPETKLVGSRLKMSLTDNKTFDLWRDFMPRRREIENPMTNDLFSMQVYDESYVFVNVNFEAQFEKWAAIVVENFVSVPAGMETFIIPSGLYAVFIH
jgi:AraC family transcriptional regulator